MDKKKRENKNLRSQLYIKYIWIRLWFKSKDTLLQTIKILLSAGLLLCTFYYLLETSCTRKLYEQIVDADTKPRVFVQKIDADELPSDVENENILKSKVIISNCGKVEARDIYLLCIIYKEEGDERKKLADYEQGPYPYVFPGQEIPIDIKPVTLRTKQKNKMNTEKPISYTLNIELKYKDTLEIFKTYKCEYIYNSDEISWDYKVKITDYSEIKPLPIVDDPDMVDPNTCNPIFEIMKQASPTTVPFNFNR